MNLNVQDLARELMKAENVLGQVERYLTAYNESMAALHLSERVMQSPLTSAVMQARTDLNLTLGRLANEETSSDEHMESVMRAVKEMAPAKTGFGGPRDFDELGRFKREETMEISEASGDPVALGSVHE